MEEKTEGSYTAHDMAGAYSDGYMAALAHVQKLIHELLPKSA